MEKKEQAQKAAKWWADKAREKSTNEKEKIDHFEKILSDLIFDEIRTSIYEVMIVSENGPEGILATAASISFVDHSMLPSRISMKITEKDIKVKEKGVQIYLKTQKKQL